MTYDVRLDEEILWQTTEKGDGRMDAVVRLSKLLIQCEKILMGCRLRRISFARTLLRCESPGGYIVVVQASSLGV